MDIKLWDCRVISVRLTGATVARPRPCEVDDCPPNDRDHCTHERRARTLMPDTKTESSAQSTARLTRTDLTNGIDDILASLESLTRGGGRVAGTGGTWSSERSIWPSAFRGHPGLVLLRRSLGCGKSSTPQQATAASRVPHRRTAHRRRPGYGSRGTASGRASTQPPTVGPPASSLPSAAQRSGVRAGAALRVPLFIESPSSEPTGSLPLRPPGGGAARPRSPEHRPTPVRCSPETLDIGARDSEKVTVFVDTAPTTPLGRHLVRVGVPATALVTTIELDVLSSHD
jgi:hypothetical protein